MAKLPDCDLCKYYRKPVIRQAAYDAKTVEGRWGYVCEEHYETNCVHVDGLNFRLVSE